MSSVSMLQGSGAILGYRATFQGLNYASYPDSQSGWPIRMPTPVYNWGRAFCNHQNIPTLEPASLQPSLPTKLLEMVSPAAPMTPQQAMETRRVQAIVEKIRGLLDDTLSRETRVRKLSSIEAFLNINPSTPSSPALEDLICTIGRLHTQVIHYIISWYAKSTDATNDDHDTRD